MKTVQIVWHEKEPISSLDFSKSGVLATAGADKTIKVRACKILPGTSDSNFDLTSTPFLPTQSCGAVLAGEGWMRHMIGRSAGQDPFA